MDLQLKFFIPLWRRIAVVLACCLWGSLEVLGGNSGWALFALVVTGYCFFQLFITFNPKDK